MSPEATPSREFLLAFARITREEILREWLPDSCVASTRIGLQVLETFGYSAKPVVTVVVAANRQAVDLMQRSVPTREWPHSAWSVGVDDSAEVPEDKFNAHLVLVMRRPGARRLLIDLSADQLDRPHRGVHVPGPVLLSLPRLWTPESPATTDFHDDTLLRYEPRVGRTDYRRGRDWIGHTEKVENAIHRAVTRMKEEVN